jgi:arsenite-transporting ATPase
MRMVLFTGKGGVGKTTLTAATSLRAAALGYKTLVVSTDVAHSLADSFGIPLSNTPTPVGPPRLFAAELDAGEELEKYWGDVKRKIASVLHDKGLEATVAGEMAIIPGLDEMLSLVRIKKYFDAADFDVLFIDSAPTGSAMRLLSAPDLNRWYMKNIFQFTSGLSKMILPMIQSMTRWPLTEGTVQEKIKTLFDKVEALRQLFTDPEVTSVRLVLNPDRMSMLETERALTYFSLYGLSVDALFVNRVLPEEISDPYFEKWKQSQSECRQQITETFSPLPIFEVPLMRHEITGIDRLNPLADSLYKDSDPTKRLSETQSIRFDLKDGKYTLFLQVTGVQGKEIDLEKTGSELKIQLGKYKRTISLPKYIAGLEPTSASLDGSYLRVVFEEEAASK